MSTVIAPTASPATADASADPAPEARISFRRPVTSVPHVDAAWWPHSRELRTELPPLLELLWTEGREVTRVSYQLDSWDPVPRRLAIGGRAVRLGGFEHQDVALLSLYDPWGSERVDIVVIAPDADPAFAERVMAAASRPGRNAAPSQLLLDALAPQRS
jgi:Family of unknown function (DUF5994)